MSNLKDFSEYSINIKPTKKPPKEESLDDIIKDISKIPSSKLNMKKIEKSTKTKNGYQQGVEIIPLEMNDAKQKAGFTKM